MKDWNEQGGAAFPVEGGEFSGLHADPGMSLRDFFAAKALGGLIANPDPISGKTVHAVISHIAKTAYAYADAMLAERAK